MLDPTIRMNVGLLLSYDLVLLEMVLAGPWARDRIGRTRYLTYRGPLILARLTVVAHIPPILVAFAIGSHAARSCRCRCLGTVTWHNLPWRHRAFRSGIEEILSACRREREASVRISETDHTPRPACPR